MLSSVNPFTCYVYNDIIAYFLSGKKAGNYLLFVKYVVLRHLHHKK
jgi:hypothetical protein